MFFSFFSLLSLFSLLLSRFSFEVARKVGIGGLRDWGWTRSLSYSLSLIIIYMERNFFSLFYFFSRSFSLFFSLNSIIYNNNIIINKKESNIYNNNI